MAAELLSGAVTTSSNFVKLTFISPTAKTSILAARVSWQSRVSNLMAHNTTRHHGQIAAVETWTVHFQ